MNKNKKMDEQRFDECIRKIAEGDMDALKELYEELRIPIYKFALSMIKSPELAEDIAQESFLRIRANASEYQPKGKTQAWIFTIVRNLAVSKLREEAKKRNMGEWMDKIQDTNLTTEMYYMDSYEATRLLDLLKADEKEIVALHVLSGLKHTDIARILNMPYEKVRWKYAYAIQKLKKHLTTNIL